MRWSSCGGCLAGLVAIVGCAERAAELDGTYEARSQMPTLIYRLPEGTMEDGPPSEVIDRFQFLPDHGLRSWSYQEGKLLSDYYSYGAWLIEDDRLYLLMGSGVGWREFRFDGDRIILSGGEGWGMPLDFNSQESSLVPISGSDAEFPFPVKPTDADYARLQALVAGTRNLAPFEGAASREELLAAAMAAFESRDLDVLLKLSYPLLKRYLPDERLDRYFSYASLLTPEIAQVESDATGMTGAPDLERKARSLLGVSPSLEVRGSIDLTPADPGGGTLTYYYGTVNDRWAILGRLVGLDDLPEPLVEQ